MVKRISKSTRAKMLRTRKRNHRPKSKSMSSKKRLWNLDNGLTFSSLSKWLENPEVFWLSFVEGLTPRRLSKPLEFGSIIHLMLEHQFKGKRKRSPITVAKEISSAYETIRAKTVLANERENLHVICQVAKMIFPFYCDFWKEEDKAIEWIEREQKFQSPYKFTDLEGKPRTILLRGMRDGLFRDDGGEGVFETKTRETINQDAIRNQLRADMQTLLYLFTARIDRKKQPSQILYNIIRRPRQRKNNETANNFVKRILDDVSKRPEHYFMRWHVDVDSKDYDNFESRTLLPTLRKFCQWWDNTSVKKNRWDSPYHLLNLNALAGPFGASEYWEAIVNGRQSTYYTRSVSFPELDESILAA